MVVSHSVAVRGSVYDLFGAFGQQLSAEHYAIAEAVE